MISRLLCFSLIVALASADSSVRQFGMYEVSVKGPASPAGNPFTDVELFGTFSCPPLTPPLRVRGFYDGGDVYKVRFMPRQPGECSYVTESSTTAALNGRTGNFTVEALAATDHGKSPVRVRNTRSFQHEDGSSHFSVGTTSYAWIHQNDTMIANTVSTLSDPSTPFNKMRMTIFPKWYIYNRIEPEFYPYVGTAPSAWEPRTRVR